MGQPARFRRPVSKRQERRPIPRSDGACDDPEGGSGVFRHSNRQCVPPHPSEISFLTSKTTAIVIHFACSRRCKIGRLARQPAIPSTPSTPPYLPTTPVPNDI